MEKISKTIADRTKLEYSRSSSTVVVVVVVVWRYHEC